MVLLFIIIILPCDLVFQPMRPSFKLEQALMQKIILGKTGSKL